ncbi:hypothetical protein B0H66DRAFT_577900 [Apodospora peruviana]|uniref:Ketoreductase domain-containing protein n=1 Tax=Apodospora peruviana TaxID=516989 RepID=A0AAE0M015_9PEZI|nr:hypothetical protein B0H66DRAFT_577900 [Apodospora peruviana]
MSADLSVNALFRVDGMIAVVTGGGTGIGLAMARALAVNGAKRVYLLGRRAAPLAVAATQNPGVFDAVQCDVTDKASLQAVVDKITRDVGYVNLVIANAGAIGSPKRWDPSPSKSIAELRKDLFTDNSMEEMTAAFQVNVTGAFFTMTAFLELLDAGNKEALKGGFGKPLTEGSKVPSVQSQVIITSSISAFSRHAASVPAYCGSKAAIMQLAKQAATQLGGHGIRVNALAPGIFPSDLASGIMASRKPEEETPDNTMFIPAKRFGTDEEMAGTLLYLASRAGAYCNGSAHVVDGGRLAVMPSTY